MQAGNIALLMLLGVLAVAGSLLALPALLLLRLGRWAARLLRLGAAAAPAPAADIAPALLAAPTPLVITVHGTFAPGAAWTSPGQGLLHGELALLLAQARQDPGAPLAWHCHEWGGANTVAARHAGVLALRAKLDRVFAAQPQRRVVLIGHSHGGNIALKAAEAHAGRHLHVLTLATPFLIVQRRRFGLELAMMLSLINALVIGAIAGVGVTWLLRKELPDERGFLIGLGIAVLVTLPAMAYGLLRGLPAIAAEAQALQDSALDLSRLEPLRARTLICSRVGDEADGGLKLVSLLNAWLVRTIRSAALIRLMQQLTELLRAQVPADAPLGGAALRDTVFAALLKQPRLLWRIWRSLFNSGTLMEMFAAWMGLLLLEVLQPAVGTRSHLVGAVAAVTSSETPPGEWRHLQSLYALDDDSALLSHSQIYADAALRAQACRWIVERLAEPAPAANAANAADAGEAAPQAPQGFR